MRNGNDSTQSIEQTLQRLLPDVFFHPVWVHFIEAEVLVPHAQSQALLDSANVMLSAGYCEDACRALFICAFQNLRAGDYTAASAHLHRIVVLAEQHELSQIAWWAAWGAAAICVQQGCLRQAAEYLAHLQYLLSQQHEWILAAVIDVLRQTLLSRAETTRVDQLLSADAALSSAFESLVHWGAPHAVRLIDTHCLIDYDGHAYHATASSGTTGSLWQKIRRMVKGELKLKWVETNGSAPPPHLEERHALIPTLPAVTTFAHAPLLPASEQPPTLHQLPEIEQSLVSVHDQEPATGQPLALDQPEAVAEAPTPPSITTHLLGKFSFSVNETTVQSWPSGKGRAVFKYLLTHHHQPISRDVLMDAFWPQAGPEAARNSLNVALHNLRQVIKTVTDVPVILFEEGSYCINPEFQVWTDVDEFDRHVKTGRRLETQDQLTQAIAEYEAAVEHYQGDFLSDDLYEEWPVLTRERLRVLYLETLDRLSQLYFERKQYAACIAACQQILARDNCREDTHCRLMQCFCRQDQRHLALRQYQTCVEALHMELDVEPASTTTQLYERIRRRERV